MKNNKAEKMNVVTDSGEFYKVKMKKKKGYTPIITAKQNNNNMELAFRNKNLSLKLNVVWYDLTNV